MPAKVSADGFAKKFFQAESKGDRWLGSMRGEFSTWGQELIERYSAHGSPKMGMKARKAFVREFLDSKTVGSPILGALLSILVPLFLRLFESWLNREGA